MITRGNKNTFVTFHYDLYLSNVPVSECTRVITSFTVSRAHLQHNYVIRMNKQYIYIIYIYGYRTRVCTYESLYMNNDGV